MNDASSQHIFHYLIHSFRLTIGLGGDSWSYGLAWFPKIHALVPRSKQQIECLDPTK
jgi:hypothetical protein